MVIKKLIIENLFGYMNKEIVFNEDISVLVGINGAGKTNILKVLAWLLKPNIPYLCVTCFKRLELGFTFKNDDYRIICKQTNKKLIYGLSSSKKEVYTPLEVSLDIAPSKLLNDEDEMKQWLSKYSNLRPNGEEIKIWQFLNNELPRTEMIGLDRSKFSFELNEFEHRISKNSMPRRMNFDDPINEIKAPIRSEYQKKRNEIFDLTESLKNQLILFLFQDNMTLSNIHHTENVKLTIKEVNKTKEDIVNYVKTYLPSAFNKTQIETIESYFDEIIAFNESERGGTTDKLIMEYLSKSYRMQYEKIIRLSALFDKFRMDSEKAMEHIDLYLDTLNILFSDSYKKFEFDKLSNELCYRLLDRKLNLSDNLYDIRNLSSGERQILILLSRMAFCEDSFSLFLIDEPELSLHIRWQEKFFESLFKLAFNKVQLVIATHSPIFAGQMKDKAIQLYPYN